MKLGELASREGAITAVGAIRRRSRFVLACMGIGVVIGTAAAYLIPSVWTSDAMLKPEEAPMPQMSGALAGLASQLAGAASPEANAQLFTDLITTRVVTRRLAKGSYPSAKGVRPLAAIYGYEDLPPEERLQKTTAKLSKSLSASMDFRTGIVSFSVKARTPEMAKALADSVLAVLNDVNVELRQKHAREEREFAEERVADAQRNLNAADDAVLSWEMHNRETTSPALQQQFVDLKRQQDVALQLYEQVRTNLEQAKLQEVRNTPAITILAEPLLPTERTWPRRKLVIGAATLAGAAVAIAYVLLITGSGITPPVEWSYQPASVGDGVRSGSR